MTHTVTAPLVIAKDDVGHNQYVYQGTPLPGNIPDKEIARLVELGLISDDAPGVFRAGAIGVDASATASGRVELPGATTQVELREPPAEKADDKPARTAGNTSTSRRS